MVIPRFGLSQCLNDPYDNLENPYRLLPVGRGQAFNQKLSTFVTHIQMVNIVIKYDLRSIKRVPRQLQRKLENSIFIRSHLGTE